MSILDKLSSQVSEMASKISTNAAQMAEEAKAQSEEQAASVDVDFFMELGEPELAHVTCDVLNIRRTPSTEEARIGTLKRGDAITVKAICDDWLNIDYNGDNAYVFGAYTDYDSPEMTVNASSLNVRKGPGTEHDKVGSLENGMTVKAIAEKDGWVKILYNGKIGYVSRQYLQ